MKQIKEDIRRAEHLMNRLKNQHPISKLEPSTLSEIRRYTNPTPAVKDILSATYILLGHDIEYAKVCILLTVVSNLESNEITLIGIHMKNIL